MTDPKDTPTDDGDRTAGGGFVDPQTDGTADAETDETPQTGLKEAISGRYGSDVD